MLRSIDKSAKLYDFFIGMTRSGKIMAKRYSIVTDPDSVGYGLYSDYPLWSFDVPTIGL
jgi:hypothetical protein